MTDDAAFAIQQAVWRYLDSAAGRGLDIGVPAHLALLVDAVSSVATDITEEALWLMTAMCWLGPRRAGPPPMAMRRQAHELLRQYAPHEATRLERVMEIVIAYGCGKWRQARVGAGGWEQRWQGAMRGLVRAMEPAVAQANRWLSAHVVGYPSERSGAPVGAAPERTAEWSDAWMLATRFICPERVLTIHEHEILTVECTTTGLEGGASEQVYQIKVSPGGKLLWTLQEHRGTLELPYGQKLLLDASTTVLFIVRDEDVILKATGREYEQQIRLSCGQSAALAGPVTLLLRECTCGTTHCIERHRLASWNPLQQIRKTETNESARSHGATVTLWDCVASAVKGPQTVLKTGAFVQGMYFPLLAQEGITL